MKKEDGQLLKKETNLKGKNRVCGNCRYHNSYNYPDQIFCFAKFQKKEDPVTSVLDFCPQWASKPQECFCLDDKLKNNEKKSK